MATVRTCATPEATWGLVSHHLGGQFGIIGIMSSKLASMKDDEQRGRQEDNINRERSRLIGCLFELVCRMNDYGHEGEANKIHELLKMVMNEDLTDPIVRKSICTKHLELDDNARQFAETVARLQRAHDADK